MDGHTRPEESQIIEGSPAGSTEEGNIERIKQITAGL